MKRVMALPAAAAIIVAAGCGGSTAAGVSNSKQHTTIAAAAPPTAASDGSSTPSDRDLSGTTLVGFTSPRQMRAYFREVSAVRAELAVTHRSTRALDAAIAAHDGDAAGTAAKNAAASVRKALTLAKGITPKEPLRTVHSQLVANLRLGVRYLTRMSNDINSRDMRRIRRWPRTVIPTLRRSERRYTEWATNAAAFASGLGIRPPGWLRTMDRWN